MSNWIDNIKKSVREMEGYKEPPFEARIKLNQNENPFPVPDDVKNEILDNVKKIEWGRYPENDPSELRNKLGDYVGYKPEGILVGNGSDEMILSVILATISKKDTILIPSPTFIVYILLGNILEGELIKINLKENFQFDVEKMIIARKKNNPKLTFIPSPNNPTGCILTVNEIKEILNAGNGILAIDEAYIQFSDNPRGAIDLIDECQNLIILRTFSKALCSAGLRIGFIITNPELARQIRKTILPYNMGIFTRVAALKIIEKKNIFEKHFGYIIEQREYLYDELKKINGIKAYPSQANFILFECLEKEPKEVFKKLHKNGILIRDMTSYPMLSKAFRVTVGKKENNEVFIEKLREIMES